MRPHDSQPNCIDMKHHGVPYGHKAAKGASQRIMYSHAILFRTVVASCFLSYHFILLLLGRRLSRFQSALSVATTLSVAFCFPPPSPFWKTLYIHTNPKAPLPLPPNHVLVVPMLSPKFSFCTPNTYLSPQTKSQSVSEIIIPSARWHYPLPNFFFVLFCPIHASPRSGNFFFCLVTLHRKISSGILEKKKQVFFW